MRPGSALEGPLFEIIRQLGATNSKFPTSGLVGTADDTDNRISESPTARSAT